MDHSALCEGRDLSFSRYGVTNSFFLHTGEHHSLNTSSTFVNRARRVLRKRTRRGFCVCVCSDLVRGLELRWSSGEEEVQQGAVWDQVTHSWTVGYELAGLKQQRPGTQNMQY